MLQQSNSDRYILGTSNEFKKIYEKFTLKKTISLKNLNNKKKNLIEKINPKTNCASPFDKEFYGIKTETKTIYNNLLKNQIVENLNLTNNKKYYLFNKENQRKKIIYHSYHKYNEIQKNKNFFKLLPINNKINQTVMFKILDAPNLLDDFYIHILSWSENNIISIALNNEIYLLNYLNNSVNKLYKYENQITSLNFTQYENKLSVGLNDGNLCIYDINKFYSFINKRENNIENLNFPPEIQSFPHRGRIGIIINSPNDRNLITTGSIDHKIKIFDLRTDIKKSIKELNGHSQEICGLAYNLYGNILISGGNDNNLNIWDMRYEDKNLTNIEKAHHSAIRAIDCSKIKNNIFITGGGINDRKIKVWNLYNFNVINQIETNSQICDIKFSKFNNEFITTNGYNNYFLNFWNFDDKYKFNLINSNKSHKNRILYIDISKDNNQTVVTGSGDETIRFWKIFSEYKEKSQKKSLLTSLNEFNNIR